MAGPLTPGSRMMPMSPQDPATQLNTFKTYVTLIADTTPGIVALEKKLKAAQELSENFEVVVGLPQYPQFLGDAMRIFLKILQESDPSFIGENNTQQLRKLLLEIIHRIPTNDHLKPYVKGILNVMFKLLETDNEENVLICLRIIIELHKQFRPAFCSEVQQFLKYVKEIYKKLPNYLPKIFDQRGQIKVRDLTEVNIEVALEETFTITTILTEKKNAENQPISFNLIPKAELSLKVLAELPIIVVLMYQLYKQNVHSDIAEFIPLIMSTIVLQPTNQQKANPAFNKEVFVDFIAAQIKTLSFLAYIIRIYQENINVHSVQMVKGMLGLLTYCPQEVAHLRKELLIAARHILATDLRTKFVPCIEKLFDENVLIGSGWTTYESLRPLAYSTLADLVHHVRQSLSLSDLALAVNLFSKNVHDESLPSSIQTMSCKLLLNLVECIRAKSEVENGNGRELFTRMLEVFVLKFKTISETQLPYLLNKCRQQETGKATSTTTSGAVATPGVFSQGQASPPLPLSSQSGVAIGGSNIPPTPSADIKTPGLGMADVKEECKTPVGLGPTMPSTPSAGGLGASTSGLGSMSSTGGLGAMSSAGAGLTAGSGPLGFSLSMDKDETKTKSGTQVPSYTVVDCRGLVKTLVSGVKTITWGIASCKSPTMDAQQLQNKQFFPKETLVYIRLVQYALQALDIYTLNVSPLGQTHTRSPAVQSVRSKEEKEVLEHFAGVFIMMSPLTFKEIFATTIEYMVERIHQNYALQIVANSFLANLSTSATFATILVEYLLKHMEEMGSNVDRSNLYLKLFKLVFGSVSLLANENEQMLKPHLHTIVNRSMELARTAKEPFNYFLLLRALFRSIGGGSHDLLYQEFLPLLPNLLQGLNSLQSGLHKQQMKDLFVELCLTVPVRLSSLLPYLPMLMDPLVSALNGSQTLISQGLRTLELCVDNLQPDFLYNHIQPVRAELMQALWRCLHNSPDNTANVAFRVLGKFGGSNRKMLREAQKLNYDDSETIGPCLTIYLQECKTPVMLPVESSIEAAFNVLKSPSSETFYRQSAWDLIRSFLVACINLEDDLQKMNYLYCNVSFTEKDPSSLSSSLYKCSDLHVRRVQQQALAAMFVAAANKELSSQVSSFMVCIVCHYTMIAVAQQAGPFPLTADKTNKLLGVDPHVLVDSLTVVMGNEEKDLCVPSTAALKLMLTTTTSILGSKDKACQLPMFEYMAEKMAALCYERAWYTKLGGCTAIKFLYENMSYMWILEHQLAFIKALLFVIMDLTGEVSNGALDMAKMNMESLLRLCAQPLIDSTETLTAAQNKSLFDTVHELVRHVTSPNTLVREQVMHMLKVLSDVMSISITDIMEPHKDVLNEMIPPKKHLLRYQPANAQIGLMEGNAFCTTLEPRLFTMDMGTVEHKLFFTELISLCEAEDQLLMKLPCYKSLSSLIPLRKSAMKALSACHYIPDVRQNVFTILYKALNSEKLELQLAAHDCMKRFIGGFQIDMPIVHAAMRPLLLLLGDFSNLSVNRIQVLSSLTQLFPNTFNEKLCEQLLAHFKKWIEVAASPQKLGQTRVVGQVLPNELKICAAIIEIFHLIPAASVKMIEPLTSTMLKGEKELFIEAGSPFRQPLMKFLLRYPEQTIDLFLSDGKVQDQQWNRFFEWLLRQPDGQPFRAILQSNPTRIQNLISGPNKNAETQFLAILVINILVSFDADWLVKHQLVVSSLLCLWVSPDFQERHKKIDCVDYTVWQETHMLIECLLNYFVHQKSDVELLFHMLRCFTARYLPQFLFFKEFLDETVAQTYSVEWKRNAFRKFVDVFRSASWSQDLKAKILQYVLIPCFAASFERDEGEKLIGGPPSPDQENPNNIISVFINDIIDPDNPFGTSDAVRILLLQFASLLVEQASHHIHDAANKKQGNKLRRLMTFAWPCLLPKMCVDPATKYHGHLLLSHIIAKFAIHKRIVLQVFHSLLKAHAVEARSVVRQALEILTPAMPGRMEDGNTMLTHWTKKIIVEEGHTVAQLVHILQLIVQHYKVYYPVRHHLIQHIVTSVQKLGLTPNATMEHRRLAVDLSEVIVKWESQRIKEESEESSSQVAKTVTEVNKPIEKQYCDTIVNFLLRLACHANEGTGTPGDLLSRRCVAILKKALSSEVWPNSELKLVWFDKILMTVEGQQPNFNNICTALELLAFLLTVLKKDLILPCFKPLQRGIAACMTCPNSRVIRMVHSLLTRLMSIFPTESATSNVASKYEELECLYACVSKVVYEGLNNYDKMTTSSPPQLFGTLMILKAACMNNACYIDRLITSFMRVLQRMAREHLAPSSPDLSNIASELLILSLDLVKNRVGVMSPDMRKAFIGSILVGLIDKTQDNKVMKAIMKMVEDWVKTKTAIAINQSPSLREKAILLVKLSQHVEKRFPDDAELNAQFLDLIYYVYRDDSLRNTELTSKLEPAFLAGLRCSQPHIRQKFMEVFDASIRRRLFDRLQYIVTSQNWESMGSHFWIKQCIELVLNVSTPGLSIQNSNPLSLLPSATNVINMADTHDRSSFVAVSQLKEEPMDVQTYDMNIDDDDVNMALLSIHDDPPSELSGTVAPPREQLTLSMPTHDIDQPQMLRSRIQRQAKFLAECREVKSSTFLGALVQLCHSNTTLAYDTWVQLFPRCWKILTDRMQSTLSSEIGPFICSGSHVVQKDCHPSAISAFVEAVFRCGPPPIPLKPCVIKYIAKSHNLWHRALLVLEQTAADAGFLNRSKLVNLSAPAPQVSLGDFDSTTSAQQDTLESLCELYSLLKEDDMFTAVWQKRAKNSHVSLALSYEQFGFFDQAQTAYETAITEMRSDHNSAPASVSDIPEHRLVEEHWIRCAKELNQWEVLTDYGTAKGNTNPHLVMESSWRLPNYWAVFKDSLTQVEQSCPKEMAWKVHMYRGYLAVCNPEDIHINMIERLVEMASNCAIKEWRRLPSVVSQIHVVILQAAQQIIELQESVQINQGLQPANLGRDSSIHDMKAIVKTWRNRMPMVSDDLSHWSDILHWRQHHYRSIVSTYEAVAISDQTMANHSMLGVHHTAMATVHYGKIARKHGLTGVCLDLLSSIHQIPSVPIVDCYHKIRQQVKCYLQMSGSMGKNELQEGLDVIESTNLKYFPKEMTSEFCALKGMFLAQIGRSEDANKAFSTAVQVYDTLVKAWALWGDYLENLFTRERNIKTGVDAITCYLHACRHQNEAKTRKYLSRVLWLLTYDNESLMLAEAVDKYSVGVQPVHWLPWIPQLLTCLVRNEGRLILNLLSKVGSVYPQAVYFPIRTLYLTLKIEQRERFKSGTGEFANRSAAMGAATGVTDPLKSAASGMEQSAGGGGEPAATPRPSGLLISTDGTLPPVSSSMAQPTPTAPSNATAAAGVGATVNSSDATCPSVSGGLTPSSVAPLSVIIPGTPTLAGAQGTQGATGPSLADIGPIKATTPMWRCSRIMHIQRDMHPTVLSSLEGIVDQMVWFRENWYEEVLRQLRQGLAKCRAVAFENRANVTDTAVTPHTLNFVCKLVSTFGVGVENSVASVVTSTFSSAASESLARRAQATAQDPIFQRMKSQFTADFDFNVPGSTKLHNLISKLKKWIKILEARIKTLPKTFLIEEKCRFLSNFSLSTAEVELPGEFLLPKHSHYFIRIERFMPRVEIVNKHNAAARRLYIRGHNGKIYPYLIVNDACLMESRREERVLQLLRMFNYFLGRQKETGRRLLNFAVPRVVAVSPQMRLIEDNPSSLSLLDIYKQCCAKRNVEHDAPISRYYERLAAIQARGSQPSHQVLREILKEVQTNMIPRTLLKEWAIGYFPNATDFWTFRKNITIHLAVWGFAEFAFCLTRMNPDMLYLHLDSGFLNVSYYKFDTDDVTGELNANRPVPFRLTPNIAEFLTAIGVSGPLTAAMLVTARCLAYPQYRVSSFLAAVLRDEYITWHKKKQEESNPNAVVCDADGETLILLVNKAIQAIMLRIQNLATCGDVRVDSRVSTLVAAANSLDNLCRMDPAWHPWL